MAKKIEAQNNSPEDSKVETQHTAESSNSNLNESEVETDIETEAEEEQSFSEKWKTHRFLLVRGTYFFFHSIWMVVMVIGGVIAWLIALLFI